jgi:hypothetical protein
MEVLSTTREGWDLVFVTNLCACTAVLGIHWFRRWKWLGAFDGDLSHYIAVAKRVNDLGKASGINDENWTWFVECAALSGYRNPPFPGFDVVKETQALAEGGEEHNYYGYTWQALCREFLPMRYHPVEYTSFKDWVRKAEWLTSGASSVGRVRLTTADGHAYNIKARKNMVADVVDLGELADTAVARVDQENYTIIKSELGKLRLAVAGDIYTYLKMTWINGLLGGAYYDWPGNTTEEDFVTQTKRLARMLELAARTFGLPYDYAGFDHQPQTEEILGIVKLLCEHARLNVPTKGLREFDQIAQNVQLGFLHSTLEVRTAGSEGEKFKVTGGLMSGLRWTSVVGNAWNSVMTGLAMKLLTAWGIETRDIERFIRGDDSAIFVPNWATGAAMNLAYDAVGAKAGAGKFSLQNHQMEFLRVWFDRRCRGYPVRAVPGLTQRKPWSSNPWSEDMILRAIYEACRTLKRRATEREEHIEKVWKTLRHIWCVNHSLPDAVCWAPVFAGGLGIEPQPVGESWRIVPGIPKADTTLGMTVDNQRSWRADNLRAYASERYGIELGEMADQIARDELLSTITADNVPSVAREVRSSWLHTVRHAGCRAHRRKVPVVPFQPPIVLEAYRPEQVDMLLLRLKAHAPEFGSCPEVEIARSDYDRFRPAMGFRDWIRRYFPRIEVGLRVFHSSWHISERLDYLGGHLPIAVRRIHPAMMKILAWTVATVLQPRRKSTRNASLWAGGALENEVSLCPLSQVTYWW